MSWLSRLFGRSAPAPSLPVSRLVVGLGNPGPDYVGTRHNAGFMVLRRLADDLGTTLDLREGAVERGQAVTAEVALDDDGATAVALATPLTFMNRSGQAVVALLGHYGLGPDDLLVVYDDLALPLGALRLRGKGSHGGHNGIRDIADRLGSTEFPRLRVGVGNSFPPGGQVDFVLSPFDDDELAPADAAVADAAQAALTFARDGLTTAMNRHNRR